MFTSLPTSDRTENKHLNIFIIINNKSVILIEELPCHQVIWMDHLLVSLMLIYGRVLSLAFKKNFVFSIASLG